MELRSSWRARRMRRRSSAGSHWSRGRRGGPPHVLRGLEAEGLVRGDGRARRTACGRWNARQHVAALQTPIDFARDTDALRDVCLREVEALSGAARIPPSLAASFFAIVPVTQGFARWQYDSAGWHPRTTGVVPPSRTRHVTSLWQRCRMTRGSHALLPLRRRGPPPARRPAAAVADLPGIKRAATSGRRPCRWRRRRRPPSSSPRTSCRAWMG